LSDDIKANKAMVLFNSDIMQQGLTEANNVFGGTINTVLGEEKQNVIDPAIQAFGGLRRIFGSVRDKFGSSNDDSFDDLYDGQQEQTDIFKDVSQSLDDTLSIQQSQSGMIEDVSQSLDDTLSIQQDQLDLAKSESLRIQREDKDEDKKGFFEKLFKRIMIMGIAGLLAGGMVGAMIKPFEVVLLGAKKLASMFGFVTKTGTKTASIFTDIWQVFRKTPILKGITRFFDIIKDLGGFARKMSRSVKSIASIGSIGNMLKDIPGNLKKLIRFSDGMEAAATGISRSSRLLQKIPVLGKTITKVIGIYTKMITSIKLWYNSAGIFSKVMKGITKVFGFVIKGARIFFRLAGKFSIFSIAFAKGFRFLAWPFQVLMGIIDFIKGFMGSSETTFLGKILDGLKQVIVGFFEMPLKLLGWVYDKILGLFGIESKGTGEKLVSAFSGLLDAIIMPIKSMINLVVDSMGKIWDIVKSVFSIFTDTFGAIWSLLTGDFSGFVDSISNIWENVKSIILNGIEVLFAYLTYPIRFAANMVKSVWDTVKGSLDGTMFEPLIKMFDTIGSFIANIVGMVKGKLSKIPLIGDLFKDEKTKAKEQTDKDSSKVDKIQQDRAIIRQQMVELDAKGEDDGGFFGKSNKTKMKILKKKEQALTEKIFKIGGDIKKRSILMSPPQDKVLDVMPKGEKMGALRSTLGFFTDTKKQFSHVAGTSNQGTAPNSMISTMPAPTLMISDMSSKVNLAKNQQANKQIEQTKMVERSIIDLSKVNKQASDRPIIINTGGEDKKMIEPPTDIESMSILWLNKSWGLG